MLAIIVFGGIHLCPEEAQYWCWSQALDIGYYSKPPGIAYQIYLGTLLFGNTELGVRFFAVVLSFSLALATFFLAKSANLNEEKSVFAALVMAFCPLGMMGSLLALTDGGFVLFWTLAAAFHLRQEPLKVSLCIMCGALFKWPIYLFWAFARPYRLVPIALSMLGLLPSLVWNINHDFATFKHVSSTVSQVASSNFFDFVGSQVALFSPIFFGLLLASLFFLKKAEKEIRFLALVTFSLLFFYATSSLFKKIQGNWVVFAYPTAAVLVAWVASRRWLIAGLTTSIAISLFFLSLPKSLPYRSSPFVHNMGWNALQAELNLLGYDPDKHFLLSDKYQMSSLLSFYSDGQKRAHFLNMQNSRKNQFSFWPGLEKAPEQGFFVLAENIPYLDHIEKTIQHEKEDLEKYFLTVEYVGKRPLYSTKEEVVKAAIVFKCEGFREISPQEGDLY